MCKRADLISLPGIITTHIINHLLEDDLVIADITYKNPNVFYELAIRHYTDKPVIQIKEYSEVIPFDVTTTRTINVDYRFFDSISTCKEDIISQIKSIEIICGTIIHHNESGSCLKRVIEKTPPHTSGSRTGGIKLMGMVKE